MDKELKIFNNYYQTFDEKEVYIKNKYDHTFRVVSFAEEIAKSLNLSEDDILKAKICALFHDIGRFNEAKKYHSFASSNAFDHGEEGFNILKKLNYNDEIVLLSTKYHNKYSIPDGLDEKTQLFCNITRDADKLDILFTQYLKVDSKDEIRDEIYNELFKKKLFKNSINYNSNEEVLKGLALIFDINFKKSFEIIRDNNLIDEKIDNLLKINDDQELLKVKEFLNNYVKERLIC